MPKQEQLTLRFGNPNPQMQITHPDGRVTSIKAPHLEQSTTEVEFWDGIHDPKRIEHTLSTDNERFTSLLADKLTAMGEDKRHTIIIRELEDIVAVHTGGQKPTWVACDDPDVQRVVAKHFGCKEGEQTMLFTNVGRDDAHKQHMTTGTQPAAFNYMALTANSTAPAAGDTTLTGEITTAGGGLLRAQCTFAHTTGTNTSTLTKTFTANGSDSLPVTIAKIGVFNASSAGDMAYETLLSSTAPLSVSGDSVTVTETVTAG